MTFSVSEFWSILLIATDPDSDKPTPLSVVSRYLELSKDRPLDINICTHDKAEWHRGIPIEQVYSLQATKLSMLHVHEKAQVAAAMALLTPHQGRWQRLYVDVVFSTSLPRPHIDFYGTLPHLRHLVLKCYYSRGQVENVTPTTGTLEAPILESMDIYGGALCQILERGTPMLPKLNEIIIDASYHNGKYTFSLVDFVKLLPKLPLLRTLRCDSVELASSGDELPPPDLGSPPQIEEVEFTYMNGKDIEAISSCLGRPTVTRAHYYGCTFPRRFKLFHTSGSCLLTNMLNHRNIVPQRDIFNFLKDWNGPQCSTLHIESSPFSVDIVEYLTGPLPDGSWACPNLTELVLSGFCYGLSNSESAQRALVNMIKARYAFNNSTQLPPQGHPDHVVSSLTRLTVDDKGRFRCYVEADDLEWLDANLVSVRWGDWSGGSGEYLKSKSSVEGPDGEISA